MNKTDESSQLLMFPYTSNQNGAKGVTYEYRVPLLDNKIVTFPDAEPDTSEMPINHLDMDITEVCNLRCSYCFKGNLSGQAMSLETAMQSIKFLVRYSGQEKEIDISLLGGEPLLAFPLLKTWVPWVHRYCEQRGKKIKIGVTTNGTVFKKEHHDFFRAWHIGLHLSIDGVPEVQDLERKLASGQGSSEKLEKNIPLILSAWRTVHARSTIVPETVSKLSESYRYFCENGFYKVAFDLARNDRWKDPETLAVLENEFRKVLNYHWEHMKKHNRYFVLSTLDRYVTAQKSKGKVTNICHAGRGSLHVDIDGLLWPCHRFSSSRHSHQNLILGSVWGGFNNAIRQAFLKMNPCEDFRQSCGTCEVQNFCLSGCVAANWQVNRDIYDTGEAYCQAMRLLYKVCQEHTARVQKEEPDMWKRYTEWVYNYKW